MMSGSILLKPRTGRNSGLVSDPGDQVYVTWVGVPNPNYCSSYTNYITLVFSPPHSHQVSYFFCGEALWVFKRGLSIFIWTGSGPKRITKVENVASDFLPSRQVTDNVSCGSWYVGLVCISSDNWVWAASQELLLWPRMCWDVRFQAQAALGSYMGED